MWGIVMTVTMAAVTGIYMLPAERSTMAVQDQTARELAESMGVYRQSVVKYFSEHNGKSTRVPISVLRNKGMIPGWSTLYKQSSTSIWANYRDSEGVIYIFPESLPSVNITRELLALSQNSVNVGLYRASDHSLYSPVDGVRVTLNAFSGVSIPDSAPVWLAARN